MNLNSGLDRCCFLLVVGALRVIIVIRQPSTGKPRNTVSYSDDEDYVPPLKTFAEWEYKPVVLAGKRARAAVKYS